MYNQEAIWYCSKCGRKNNANADRFCPNCKNSSPLNIYTCPKCGEDNPNIQYFCRKCGYNLIKIKTKDKLLHTDEDLQQANTLYALCTIGGSAIFAFTAILCVLFLILARYVPKAFTLQKFLTIAAVLELVSLFAKAFLKRKIETLLDRKFQEYTKRTIHDTV